MKKTVVLGLFLTLAAAVLAFGHAGETHTYMGTVDLVHDDGSFVMKKKDGTTLHVQIAATTQFAFADGSAAASKDLAKGMRVVVKIATDGKTATSVKMAAPK